MINFSFTSTLRHFYNENAKPFNKNDKIQNKMSNGLSLPGGRQICHGSLIDPDYD